MNLSKRVAVAGLATVIALGLCPVCKAQVSCSPKVRVRTCKEVAGLLDAFLKLENKLGHVGIQLELVSPTEYKTRVSQIKKDLRLGPLETTGCGPGSEKSFFQNCGTIDVLFFRGSSSDVIPTHILVSSDEAEDALALSYFVQGYYEGLTAEMAEPQNRK